MITQRKAIRRQRDRAERRFKYFAMTICFSDWRNLRRRVNASAATLLLTVSYLSKDFIIKHFSIAAWWLHSHFLLAQFTEYRIYDLINNYWFTISCLDVSSKIYGWSNVRRIWRPLSLDDFYCYNVSRYSSILGDNLLEVCQLIK